MLNIVSVSYTADTGPGLLYPGLKPGLLNPELLY